MAGRPAERAAGRPARGRRAMIAVLLLVAVAAVVHTVRLALEYSRTQATWLPARALLTGREYAINAATASADARVGLRDDLSYERGGVLFTCYWDDRFAPASAWLAYVRAIARERTFHVGMRVKLRVDPHDPTRCRPAYSWAEECRLELTGGILLALFCAGGALFIRLQP